MPLIPVSQADPHSTVSYQSAYEASQPGDFDLEGTLQFVADGHATLFDFSYYGYVGKDNVDLEKTRTELMREMAAFTNLRDAVTKAHSEYMDHAADALAALGTISS
jgi:hypothetical protein